MADAVNTPSMPRRHVLRSFITAPIAAVTIGAAMADHVFGRLGAEIEAIEAAMEQATAEQDGCCALALAEAGPLPKPAFDYWHKEAPPPDDMHIRQYQLWKQRHEAATQRLRAAEMKHGVPALDHRILELTDRYEALVEEIARTRPETLAGYQAKARLVRWDRSIRDALIADLAA